jgi:hypothetical protein
MVLILIASSEISVCLLRTAVATKSSRTVFKKHSKFNLIVTPPVKMSAFRLSRPLLRSRPLALRSLTQRRGYAEEISDKIKLSLSLPHQVRSLRRPPYTEAHIQITTSCVFRGALFQHFVLWY